MASAEQKERELEALVAGYWMLRARWPEASEQVQSVVAEFRRRLREYEALVDSQRQAVTAGHIGP